MNSGPLDKLLPSLSKVTPGTLQRALSKDVVEALYEYGVPIDPHSLSEILIQVEGFNILKNKSIFNEMLGALKKDTFSFGPNKKTKLLLEELGFDPEDFLKKSERYETFIQEGPLSALHPYQQKIKKALSNFIMTESNQDSLMVKMPTGAGKTRVAMEAIYDFIRSKTDYDSNDVIMWLAHTDELCEQAVQSFKIGYQNICTTPVNILRLWGNASSIKEIKSGVTFIVCTFQSAYSMLRTQNLHIDKLQQEIRSRMSLLFIDEAHMSMADTFEATIGFLHNNRTKKIGLSATPGRDGVNRELIETKRLAHFFNDNIIDIESECGIDDAIKFLQEKKILSALEQQALNTGFELDLEGFQAADFNSGKDISDQVINQLATDKDRNRMIIEHIIELGKVQKKKILVFAASVKHAHILTTILNCYGLSAKSITNYSSITDRRNNIKNFKEGSTQILVNYNVLSTGFDEPKTDCIVIARPTFSVVLYSQMIGRGLRGTANGGTDNCLVVNVIDNIINQPDISGAYKYFDGGWNG